MKKIIYNIFALFIVFMFSLSCTSQTLSVKGRWNVKAGYSMYKLTTSTPRLIEFDWTKSSDIYKRKWNVRVEANYGVLKWLEIGAYAGLMGYEYTPWTSLDYRNAVAPTFGINANVHILPFFVKNQNCKWDFYIPLKYGGNYIPKIDNGKDAMVFSPIGSWDDLTVNIRTAEEYILYSVTNYKNKLL
jgi:hypothetical protein